MRNKDVYIPFALSVGWFIAEVEGRRHIPFDFATLRSGRTEFFNRLLAFFWTWSAASFKMRGLEGLAAPKLPPECVVKQFGSLGEWFKPAVLTIRPHGGLIAAQTNLQVMSQPKLPLRCEVKKHGSLGEWFKPAVLTTRPQSGLVSA